MSIPATDWPDWVRVVATIPPPVSVPAELTALGGANSGVDTDWNLLHSGALKIMWFSISNPNTFDGNLSHSVGVPQDAVWVQFVQTGGPAPGPGVGGGIYLPSPGFLFCDDWFGDVYVTKAREVAGNPVISETLVLSSYP